MRTRACSARRGPWLSASFLATATLVTASFVGCGTGHGSSQGPGAGSSNAGSSDAAAPVDADATSARLVLDCSAALGSSLGNGRVDVASLLIDSAGRMPLAGTLDRGPNLNADVWVASYAADCTRTWETNINSSANVHDFGFGGAVAPDDHVYVLSDAYASRFTPTGERVDGGGSGEKLRAAAVTPDGTLLLAGILMKAGIPHVWFSPVGSVGWSVELAPPAGGTFMRSSPTLATDRHGDAFVSLSVYDGEHSTWALTFAKVTRGGELAWTRTTDTFPGGVFEYERPRHGIAALTNGDAVAVGTEFVEQVDGRWISRAWLRKYDASGATKWTYRGPPGASRRAFDVAVADDGAIYVAGAGHPESDSKDPSISRFSSDGVHTWTETFETRWPVLGAQVKAGANGVLAVMTREQTSTSTIQQNTLFRFRAR